jgi:hypothetical protein
MCSFVQTPFGATDVLTGPTYYYSPTGDFTSLSQVLPNYWFNLVQRDFLIRPTQVLAFNILYVLFPGEFGLMYLLKWLGRAVAVLLLYRVLGRLGVERLSRLCMVMLVAFHPSMLEPLLWSADGLIVICGMWLLWLLIQRSSDRQRPQAAFLRIDQTGWGKYLGVFVVWFLLLGTKETAFVPCALAVAGMQLSCRFSRAGLARLAPFYALLGFWVYRLATAKGSGALPASTRQVLQRMWLHGEYLTIPSPLYVAAIALGALVVWSVVVLLRSRDVHLRGIGILCGLTAGGTLLMASIPQVTPAPRYMIPVIMYAAVPLGIGLGALPRRAVWAKAGLLLLVPLFSLGDLYCQALAYRQEVYELSEVIAVAEDAQARGVPLAVTGESFENEGCLGIEQQQTIKLYFERFGREFYGRECATPVYSVAVGNVPPQRCLLITTYSLASIVAGRVPGVDVSRIQEMAQVARGRYGLLERLTRLFNGMDEFLGNEHWPRYDNGTSVASEKPKFWLYTVDFSPNQELGSAITPRGLCRASTIAEWFDYTTHQSGKLPLGDAVGHTFTLQPGEEFKLQVPLCLPPELVLVILEGSVRIDKGQILVGIADEERDLWNRLLSAGPAPCPLPPPPLLEFRPQNKHWLFFYVPGQQPAVFSIVDLHVQHVPWNPTIIRARRREGAFFR